MGKLMDADTLKKLMIEQYNFCPAAVDHAIDICPAADAVEVVRCADCKHTKGGCTISSFWKGRLVCNRFKEIMYVKPEDFCSCGERNSE